jgi:hypothetical protein
MYSIYMLLNHTYTVWCFSPVAAREYSIYITRSLNPNPAKENGNTWVVRNVFLVTQHLILRRIGPFGLGCQ